MPTETAERRRKHTDWLVGLSFPFPSICHSAIQIHIIKVGCWLLTCTIGSFYHTAPGLSVDLRQNAPS